METKVSKTDLENLKVLFIHVGDAYKGYTFDEFKMECVHNYVEYSKKENCNKTFSQWVYGQVVFFTSLTPLI